MKLSYVFIAIVFFSCFCKDGLVAGIAILNDNETVAEKASPLVKPRILIAQKPIETLNGDSEVEKNLQRCAHAPCPMIYCENSLPPIPSQGICCQRCVTNPKCNASACPKYKCGTYLIPANFTAGECCDRCAPTTTVSSVEPTKLPVKTKETGSKPKKTRSSSSSSSKETSNSSSSEEKNTKDCGCYACSIKANKSKSRGQSYENHGSSSESSEK